jgi:catechol 2,3-dioxygenase-like lactoylglutathione lyase family enzyme
MIEHISLGTNRYPEAVVFYQRALAPLGLQLLRDTGAEAAFGTPEHWSFFLYPVPEDERVTARGMHVALGAASRDVVAAVHGTALAADAQDIFTPRLRPDISPTYFGAMFHDLDGHRIEVLTNAA